jgi:ABC-type polysaccharide/polyol phosphate transport system ATPase subunit
MWYWKGELPPDSAIVHPELLNPPSIEEKYPDNFECQNQIRRRKELQIEKLIKFQGTEKVLNKINLDCYESHLTVIIGENSAEKSMLFSVISGNKPLKIS